MFALTLPLLFVDLFVSGTFSSAWADRKAIAAAEATVHANADQYSQVIGTYHRRTTVTVADESERGWYRVIFPSPVKGFTEGWIQKGSIERFVGGQKPQAVQSEKDESNEVDATPFKRPSHYLGLIIDLYEFSPVTTQTALGEKKERFFSPGIDLEYGVRFSEAISGFLKLGYYSFSRDSSVSTVSGAYFAKGYTAYLGTDWLFYSRPSFDLGLGVGFGFSLSQAGNAAPDATGQVISQTTTGITAPTYFFRLVADKTLSRHFGIRLMGGYSILKLSGVPVTPIGSSSTASTADFQLSCLFGGLGLNFLF